MRSIRSSAMRRRRSSGRSSRASAIRWPTIPAGRSWPRGWSGLGLIESGDATFDPPKGMKCPSGGCLQSRALCAPRVRRSRHRARGARPGAVLRGRRTVRGGRRVHRGARRLCQPDLLGSLPDTPANRTMRAKTRNGGRQVPVHRGADRGRLRVDRQRARVAIVGWPREISEIEALMRQREPELPGGGSCGRPKTVTRRCRLRSS